MVIIEDEMKETITYTNDDSWWTKLSETGFKLPATAKETLRVDEELNTAYQDTTIQEE